MCGGYCPGVLLPAAADIFPASIGFEAYIQPNTGHVLNLNVTFTVTLPTAMTDICVKVECNWWLQSHHRFPCKERPLNVQFLLHIDGYHTAAYPLSLRTSGTLHTWLLHPCFGPLIFGILLVSNSHSGLFNEMT
jgi:hypothetical protein